MCQIRVLFFATLKDLSGKKEVYINVANGIQVKELKAKLVDLFPSIEDSIDTVLVAVNREYAFDEDIIPEGAEVGIFPPVSGGTENLPIIVIQITEEQVELDEVVSKITLPSTGGVCTFIGTVRAKTKGEDPRETKYLEYEAYKPMAEEKMHQVADEIMEKWPLVEGIAIVQRIGYLIPGTPTVLIACSAGHRGDGVFEAARYGIDRLKEIVPIWKKEVGPEGQEWIEGKYIPTRNDLNND
jgi:molybdopterin synthase catalytic subunit